jgi:hypothetical protein
VSPVVPSAEAQSPGVRFLTAAAEHAGCTEPLATLVHEFRHDLAAMAAGEWSIQAVADAIRTIGAMDGWQFSSTRGVA